MHKNDEEYSQASNDIILEKSPCKKFIKFNEIIGTGSQKIIFKSMNTYKMYECAWNVIYIDNEKDKLSVLNEISILKSLDHPYILKIIEYWHNEEKKEIVFITEFFTGGSLKHYINKYNITNICFIKKWCKQILEALNYIHSNNITHRDIKTNNIFIDSDTLSICIGDFGLSTKILSNKSCVGTPEYMAPEVLDSDYDNKADIYSLGICMIEMLTNETPYYECDNICQIYKKIFNKILPKSFYKIDNTDMKDFISLMLKDKSVRPTAEDLLKIFFN